MNPFSHALTVPPAGITAQEAEALAPLESPVFTGTAVADNLQVQEDLTTKDLIVTGTASLPGNTAIGTVGFLEIGYLDGVTSAIQTQLNAKAPIASPTFTGTVTLPGGSEFSSSIVSIIGPSDSSGMSFDADGDVVIYGTTLTLPTTSTTVSGDFESTSSAKGIILRSPDASRWRVTVSDAGALTVTEIV